MKTMLTCILLFLCVPVFGQQKPSELRGKITASETGETVIYTMVTLIRESDRGQRKALGDSEGNYSFGSVVPGTYTLRLEHPDYAVMVIEGVVVSPEQVTVQHAALEPRRPIWEEEQELVVPPPAED